MLKWVTSYDRKLRRQQSHCGLFLGFFWHLPFRGAMFTVIFNFIIRLQEVITFSSSKTFGECWSRALELLSGPLLYLQCPHRALGKRSEAVTVERPLFHMTDFPNCWKINLWQEREAAAGWEDSGRLKGDTCLSGVSVMSDVWSSSVWGQTGDLDSLLMCTR